MIKSRLATFSILIITLALFSVGCSQRNSPLDAEQPMGPGALMVEMPAGSTLESATFNAYIYRIDDINSVPVDIHRVLTDWDELSVTYESFHAGGALNYDATVAASFDGTLVNTPDTWVTADVTDLVRSWMDGSVPNYGFLMRKDANSPRTVFYSREGDAPPSLEMVFSTPDGEQVVIEDVLDDAFIGEDSFDTAWGNTDKLYTGYKNDFTKHSLVRFDIPTVLPPRGEDEEGCTRRIKYWKRHSGVCNRPDEITPLLPIWLGEPDGDKSRYIEDNMTAFKFLKKNHFGRPRNGITKLYAQLLAAKLNIENGADPTEIETTLDEVDAYLADHNWRDWCRVGHNEKRQIRTWKNTLRKFNQGKIGPGACE